MNSLDGAVVVRVVGPELDSVVHVILDHAKVVLLLSNTVKLEHTDTVYFI